MMRIVTRTLLCQLTDSEKVQIGNSLVSKMKEIEITKADKARDVAKHNARLKDLRAEEKRLFNAYDVGAEEREVECVEEPGEGGTVRVFRRDTGEYLEDPNSGTEKQPELPFRRPGKACEGCGNADGTHHPTCFVAQANGVDAGADDDEPSSAQPGKHRMDLSHVAPAEEPADAPKTRWGFDPTGVPHAMTAGQAAHFLAGKHTEVEDGGERFEILRLARPGWQPSAKGAEDAEADEPQPETEDAPDYTEAAEIADEQMASGDRPEADESETPKRKRGRPSRKSTTGAEAE